MRRSKAGWRRRVGGAAGRGQTASMRRRAHSARALIFAAGVASGSVEPSRTRTLGAWTGSRTRVVSGSGSDASQLPSGTFPIVSHVRLEDRNADATEPSVLLKFHTSTDGATAIKVWRPEREPTVWYELRASEWFAA
jgi:hypothetical protein